MTNEVVHKHAPLSNWADVCLNMVLVVLCIWLSESVRPVRDTLRTADTVQFVALQWMIIYCKYCGNKVKHHVVLKCVFHDCSVHVCVCVMHSDVDCSCGSCWMMVQRVSLCLMIRRSAIESMNMVTFSPVIFLCSSLPHSLLSSSPSSEIGSFYYSIISARLCAASAPSHCVHSSHSFFPPSPRPFSPAIGQRRNCNVYETL